MSALEYKSPSECKWRPKDYCLKCPHKNYCSKWSFYREGREDAINDVKTNLRIETSKLRPGKAPRSANIKLIQYLIHIKKEEINMSDGTIRFLKHWGSYES